MLKIRLQRIGKRGQAYFRVVIVEHTKKPKGKFLELLGTYDPHFKKFNANRERMEYWISKGAQISPTANNLMTNYKIWERPKMMSWKPKVKPVKSEPQSSPASVPVPVETAPDEPVSDISAETPVPETPPAESPESQK